MNSITQIKLHDVAGLGGLGFGLGGLGLGLLCFGGFGGKGGFGC